MMDQFKVCMAYPMLNISLSTSEEIIHRNNFMAISH